MKVYIVLAYYFDGSLQGAETVIGVYVRRARAEKFIADAKKCYPVKELELVEFDIDED